MPGNFRPSSDVDFKGTIGGYSPLFISQGAVNFNSRNDRNSNTPAAPTFSPNGEAVDHTINTDGSANISIEWNYTLGTSPLHPNNIDGFIIYVKADTSPASTSSYTFGTSPVDEVNYTVARSNRAFILQGAPADRFYRFGVQAYRSVDDDISSSGIIFSSVAKPPHSTESPSYRPSAQVAFTGDVTGTIAGSPATTVVTNASTAFTGTTELRNTSPPGALPSIGTIVSSPTADGNVVVTIPVTYTQGTPIADGMVLYYREGATGANSPANDHRGFSFDPDDSSRLRNFKIRLEPNTSYNFSARAYRRAEGGRKYTAFTSLATHTTVSPNYTGSLNGTPVATVISNAASGAAVATDFNTSNNRNTSPINFAPVIAADGTAVDHVINNNGSADLSFEWTWGGNEANIDGFMVYLKANTATGAYNWGTSPTDETIIDVAANKRVLAVYGVSVDKYYHFGVRAYRKVDESLANTGSAINGIVANPLMSAQPVKPTWSGAGPESTGYQPSSTVSFSGTLSGTVGSVATSNVNRWSSIASINDTGTPESFATVGATAGTNLKDQSGNQVSASTDGSPSTIFIKQNTIKIYDASGVLRVKIGNLAG